MSNLFSPSRVSIQLGVKKKEKLFHELELFPAHDVVTLFFPVP
jgi:hypothetical protein